uniref:Sulfotransferase n=1 Tax=Anas platyrhynchos TaxID=8839 RepID=A0A8B9ZIL5_ANAPL
MVYIKTTAFNIHWLHLLGTAAMWGAGAPQQLELRLKQHWAVRLGLLQCISTAGAGAQLPNATTLRPTESPTSLQFPPSPPQPSHASPLSCQRTEGAKKQGCELQSSKQAFPLLARARLSPNIPSACSLCHPYFYSGRKPSWGPGEENLTAPGGLHVIQGGLCPPLSADTEERLCRGDTLPAMGVDEVCREELGSLHGIPLYKSFIEGWPQVEAFQARHDDLLIATYPKSGTTWLSEILDMIYHDGDVEKCRRDAIFNRVPFLEMKAPKIPSGIELLEKTPSPRLVKTHLPVQLLPASFQEKGCKMIYVGRNAKDVAVSYYHFDLMNNLHPHPGTWDQYLEEFMAGRVAYGSWFDHVRGYWERRREHPILYLFYEDMKEDPRREITKVAQFLGKELSEAALEAVAQHTSFEAMRDNFSTNYRVVPSNLMDQGISPFMRKGITGDWKNHFTVAQSARFDQLYAQRMAGTDLRFRTCI